MEANRDYANTYGSANRHTGNYATEEDDTPPVSLGALKMQELPELSDAPSEPLNVFDGYKGDRFFGDVPQED